MRKLNFRNFIIISMVLFFLMFFIIALIIMTNFYFKNISEKFKDQNEYSVKIAESILEEEKQNMITTATIISSKDRVVQAFENGIFLQIDSDRFKIEDDRLTMKVMKTNKIRFIALANYELKSFLQTEKNALFKWVEFYNYKLERLGNSTVSSEKYLEKGNEKYMNEIISNASSNMMGERRITQIGIIKNENDKFFIKGYVPIGMFTRAFYSFEKESQGIVVVGEEINGNFLDKIKQKTNKQVLLTKDNRIISSTFFDKNKRIENIELKLEKREEREKKKYGEILINNEEWGFHFFPIYDYNGNIIGNIGTGYSVEEVKNLYNQGAREFYKYAIVFFVIMFYTLYLLLRKLLLPFKEIIGSLKAIKDGNYDKKLKIDNIEEFAVVSEVINIMSETIENREKALRELNVTLEKKVKERTNKLLKAMENLDKAHQKLLISEKMVSIAKMAGGIAHEINSPLGALYASAQMMKEEIAEIEDGDLKENLIENIEIIEVGSRKAREIINKLLRYTSNSKNNYEKVKLINIIKEGIEILKNETEEKNIKLNIFYIEGNREREIESLNEFKSNRKLEIEGNIYELSTAFNNVLTNAKESFDDINKTEKFINISFGIKNGNKIIEIKDNGKGIEEKNLVRVFEPFFTTKKIGDGLGLGLTFAYDVFKKSGADIEINSTKEEGTVVTVLYKS